MSRRPERIDVETVQDLLAEGRVTLVDARPRDAVVASGETIPGAVHVDPGGGARLDDVLRTLPRERLIVAFCDEPEQAASAQVARRARALGLGDASILDGGLEAWREAGGAIGPIVFAWTGARLLDVVSTEDLETLCTLALWIGAVADAEASWEPDRASMTRYLAAVERPLCERFLRFLAVGNRLLVPEDHAARVANLPSEVRARAAEIYGDTVTAPAHREDLERVLSDDESVLLLRWYTWTGAIPERESYWRDGQFPL